MAGDASRAPSALVELLAENPFWTVNTAAERLGVAYTTAPRAVAKLELQGILRQVDGVKRDRVYCTEAIMAILDEPTLPLQV